MIIISIFNKSTNEVAWTLYQGLDNLISGQLDKDPLLVVRSIINKGGNAYGVNSTQVTKNNADTAKKFIDSFITNTCKSWNIVVKPTNFDKRRGNVLKFEREEFFSQVYLVKSSKYEITSYYFNQVSNVECLNLTKILLAKFPVNNDEVESYYINQNWKVVDYKEVEQQLKSELEKAVPFISDRRSNIENNLKSLDKIRDNFIKLNDEELSKIYRLVACQKMINTSYLNIKLDELVKSFDNFGTHFRSDLYSSGNKVIIKEFGLECQPPLEKNESEESRLNRFRSRLFALNSIKTIITNILENILHEFASNPQLEQLDLELKVKKYLKINSSLFMGDIRYIEKLKEFNYEPSPIKVNRKNKLNKKNIIEEISLDEEDILSELSNLGDTLSIDDFDDL